MTLHHPPAAQRLVTEFAVLRFVDGWQIVTDARRWGRFRYCVDAEDAALRLAADARAAGRDARVLVQGPDGQLRRLDVA
jgi:hypothetical protein